VTELRARLARGYAGWERWWFEPRETSTLAVIRIGYGVLAFLWTLSQAPTLLTFYGSHGILPHSPSFSSGTGYLAWSVLDLIPGDGTVIALWVIMLAASISLIVGYRPRIGALIMFIGVVSLERRDPYVHNSGDILMRIMPLYLLLSPCGAALSLDRWRKARDRFWEFPLKSQWVVRLMQLQLSFVYLNSVWSKVRGVHWNDGTAVSIALRIGDLQRFPYPHFLSHTLLLTNFMTFGALAIEFAAGTLVWNRTARPYVLLLGASLHLGIDWTIRVGFFSYAILLFYLSFVEPPAMSRFVLAVRDRVAALAPARRPAPSVSRPVPQ
jgi:hypothetical protein